MSIFRYLFIYVAAIRIIGTSPLKLTPSPRCVSIMFHLARRRPSPPTGYSSLFHISRGRLPPPAEIAPLFIHRTCCASHIGEREEKCLGNTAPLRAYHFFPLDSCTRTPAYIFLCVYVCVQVHCWQKTGDVSEGWKKFVENRARRRDTDSRFFLFFPPPLIPAFFERELGPDQLANFEKNSSARLAASGVSIVGRLTLPWPVSSADAILRLMGKRWSKG